MNRSRYDAAVEVQRQVHRMAQNIFTEPEPAAGEVDLQRLFVRILDKEDWTDKLASGLGKIRRKIVQRRPETESSKKLRTVNSRSHGVSKLRKQSGIKNRRPHWDTNLPKELQSLVPDMREVAKAYAEMTNGYKDFIRDVVRANRLRQARPHDTSSIEDPEYS